MPVTNIVDAQIEFGARGDGVTDDAPAIQAALNTGRNVYLTKGTYLLKSSISMLTKAQLLYGDGIEVTFIKVNTTFAGILSGTNTLVSGAVSGTGGVVRLTVGTTTGMSNGWAVNVGGVGGTTEANGKYQINVVDGTHVELLGTVFAHAYTGGGTVTVVSYSAPVAQTSGVITLNAGDPGPQLRDFTMLADQSSVTCTSSTSNTFGTGSKTWTVPSGLSLSNKTLTVFDVGDPKHNFMTGTVSSYSGTTLTINVVSSNTNGVTTSSSNWSIAPQDASQLVQYPPAIWFAFTNPLVSQARFRMDRLRISSFVTGIDARGNNAGIMNDMEMANIGVNLWLDGAQDIVSIKGYHCWPFDIGNVALEWMMLQGNANCYGITTLRTDGLLLTNSTMICWQQFNMDSSYSITSTTSNTIGTGSKTFTFSGVAPLVIPNQPVYVYNTPSGVLGNTMTGTVTSISGSSITVNITSTTGSGTYSGTAGGPAWTICSQWSQGGATFGNICNGEFDGSNGLIINDSAQAGGWLQVAASFFSQGGTNLFNVAINGANVNLLGCFFFAGLDQTSIAMSAGTLNAVGNLFSCGNQARTSNVINVIGGIANLSGNAPTGGTVSGNFISIVDNYHHVIGNGFGTGKGWTNVSVIGSGKGVYANN